MTDSVMTAAQRSLIGCEFMLVPFQQTLFTALAIASRHT
jgi:hypothetical protein